MTQQQLELIKKKLEDILEANVWGLVCEDCGGGGADGQDKCSKCNGTGVYNWHYNLGVEKILQLFEQKLREVETSVVTEIIECVQENHKGTFTDEGGNDCWYIDDLVKALVAMRNLKSNKLEGKNGK